MNELIREFANDPGIRLVAALVLIDFVLGIAAAFAAGPGWGTFQFGWLGDFLRHDVLGKLIPYFGVWAAVRLGGDIEISGYGMIEESVNGLIIVALGSSIIKSHTDLRASWSAPQPFRASDNPPPQP